MSGILIILIAILFSAFFSGMEIAFISANKLRIELDKKQDTFTSRIVSIFTANPGQYIVTMLIGNNIALVIFGIFMAILLKPILVLITGSEITILFIQTILSTFVILISAEFLPKALFRLNPNGFLNLLSLPVLFFFFPCKPRCQVIIHESITSLFWF